MALTQVPIELSSTPGIVDNSNATAITIDSSENVGIGTSSPASLLDVSSTGSVVSTIRSTSTSGARGAKLRLNVASTGGDDPAGTIEFTYGTGYTVAGSIAMSHTNPAMKFLTGTTERVRIDSSGNVGIGTTSPQAAKFSSTASGILELAGTKPVINIHETDVTDAEFFMGMSGGNALLGTSGTGVLIFKTGTSSTSEAMRIDSSGSLMVGTTSSRPAEFLHPDGFAVRGDVKGQIQNTVTNAQCAIFNRDGSDGEILLFRKEGAPVGSIGTNGGFIYIEPQSSGNGLTFLNTSVSPCTSNGGVSDNFLDLGTSSRRFDDIYATNGTIQTSDRNEKQDIEALSDAEQRVAVAAKGLLRKFRWIDAVEAKGDDARIHFGIIAQDLQDAFTAEGLDAGRYAMFINSTWTDEETGEERSRMGVRYSELLAFIISAI